MKKFALLFSVIFSVIFSQQIFATDYVVNTVSNSGTGSLPDALNQALNNGTGPHRIIFDIPAASADVNGKYVIQLNNGLNIDRNTTIEIDGTTQPGYVCEPLIVLRGNSGQNCFTGNGATINVKGFIIQGWEIGFNYYQNTRGSIKTCWIGLDNLGTSGNTGTSIKKYGIYLGSNSSNMVIGGSGCEGNVISNIRNDFNNEDKAAIFLNELQNNGSSISIKGNFIGTDKTGTIAVENGKNYPLKERGIWINKTHAVTIDSNIVSNTAGNGIEVFESNNGVVKGNIIGLDKSGTVPMGNKGGGIRVENSTNIIIGGTTTAERNIISANGGAIDARPCGQVYCGEPCRDGCPDKYDATLQCGIYFTGVTNSFIRGNYIGTDGTGNSTGTNNRTGNLYAGVKMEPRSDGSSGSTGNTIGGPDETFRNVIGGNGFDIDAGRHALGYEYKGHGIQLNKASVQSTTISNNYIGVGADGSSPIGNRQDGISLLGASNNRIANNVISDNAFGIFMQSDFSNGVNSGQPANNTIVGNLIGTDATGAVAIGNGVRNKPGVVVDNEGAGIGIQHGSNTNIIGGTTAAERNIISGNYFGIMFRFGGSGNSATQPRLNTILGNYIGVDASGEAALPNKSNGLLISQGANTNTIGGTVAGAANVISGNDSSGVKLMNGDENRFFGNKIGVSASGVALPNDGDGIEISAEAGATAALGSIGNIIGGPLVGQANTIANNSGNGIAILDAKSITNSITRNSISCNGLRGIELNGLGNNNFAAPKIHSNSTDEVLRGEAPANSYVEIFLTDNCGGTCAPGNMKLQGVTYVGFAIADAEGKWTFTQPTPTDYTLFTATASQVAAVPTAAVAYNTSEFSSCINVCEAVTELTLTAPELTICSDEIIPTFTAVATGGFPKPLIFHWYKVDGAVSTPPVSTDTKTDVEDTISVFTPTEAGVYYVDVTTALPGCTTTATAQTLVINTQPTVSIDPVTSICETTSLVLDATGSSEDLTYAWTVDGLSFATEEDPTVTPASDGTFKYKVVATSPEGCSSDADSVSLVVDPKPEIFLTGDDATICSDETIPSFTVKANGGDPRPFTFNWTNAAGGVVLNDVKTDPTDTTSTFTPFEAGEYHVNVIMTATGCATASETKTLVINTTPTVTVDPVGEICLDESMDLNATGSDEDLDYEWIGSDLSSNTVEDPTATPTTDGSFTYEVFVTSPEGCGSDTASVVLVVNPKPVTPQISGDASRICFGDSVAIEITTAGVVDKIEWYQDGNLINVTGTPIYSKVDGTYTVVLENETTGCRSERSNEVEVDVTEEPDDIEVFGDGLYCDGDFPTLSTNYSSTSNATILWYKNGSSTVHTTGGSLPIRVAADSGSYKAVVTINFDGGLECPYNGVDSAIVKLYPRPVIEVSSDPFGVVCAGNEIKLQAKVIRTSFDNTVTYPDHDFFEFKWQGEIIPDSLYDPNFEGKDTIVVNAQYRRYIVSVEDLRLPISCPTTDDVIFTDFVDVRIVEDTLDICLNGLGSIVTVDSSTAPYPYGWEFENRPLKYTEIFSSNIDSTVLMIEGIATVDAITFGQEYYFLNVGQCVNMDSVLVRVHPNPVVDLVSDLDTICANTQVNLFATAANGTPYKSNDRKAAYDYFWYDYDSTNVDAPYIGFHTESTLDTNVAVKPYRVPEQIYFVTVRDSVGCTAYDSLILNPQSKQNLVIPNLITPNGDNRNEVLVIKDKDTGIDIFPGAEFRVYNRWGQAVFRSDNYDNTWGGENCTEGVYYFTLEAGCGDDEYKGWVQIMSNEN